MEVYVPENSIIDVPKPYDTSLDIDRLVGLFSARAKNFQRSSANKYLFSFRDIWLCVVPYRGSTYRVIGRGSSIAMPIVKVTQNYDVFFVGELSFCVEKWRVLVLSLLKMQQELF